MAASRRMASRRLRPQLRIPAARNAWVMLQSPPSKSRGRRESRMRAAPAVSCANCAKETHTSIQVQRRHSGFPCAMVLTAAPRSPRCTGLVSHRRLAKIVSQGLTPASGGQDHTAWPSEEMPSSGAQARLKHLLVHRIPLPTSVTIAIRPSCGGGMGGDNHIFLKNGRGIFLAKGLDTFLIRRSDLAVGAVVALPLTF
jgi:hypothetical protein